MPVRDGEHVTAEHEGLRPRYSSIMVTARAIVPVGELLLADERGTHAEHTATKSSSASSEGSMSRQTTLPVELAHVERARYGCRPARAEDLRSDGQALDLLHVTGLTPSIRTS
jgi:hypothetical protein